MRFLLLALLSFNGWSQETLKVDVNKYYQDEKTYTHSLIIDSVIFKHTLWTNEDVKYSLGRTIEALKKCQIKVIEATISHKDISDYINPIFLKDEGFTTEDEVDEVAYILEKNNKRGVLALFLRLNGSITNTIGAAFLGDRTVSVWYYSSHYMDIAINVAEHSRISKTNTLLHEMVH
jgi:hypothetical protein